MIASIREIRDLTRTMWSYDPVELKKQRDAWLRAVLASKPRR